MQVNNYNTVPSKSPHEIHGNGGDKGRYGKHFLWQPQKTAPSAIISFWFPLARYPPGTSLYGKARG